MAGLKNFFEPESVALIGASETKGVVGRTVLDNLLLAKDTRRVYPVNPNREKILDLKCYSRVSELPEIPDLVIVVTNAKFVPDVIEEAGQFGVKNAIIMSSGFREAGDEGKAREQIVLDSARSHGMRIIGPNCLGVIRPSANLNATFAPRMTKPGRVAFLSQSGALGSAVFDWAAAHDIGFSAFASLGVMLDVDFGDLIDFLGQDRETSSILIYLESLGNSLENAKKFMSAARGFARNKPIIVIKPGKFQESVKAARSHTGAMVGEDSYYDAAFDRAGSVRVEEIADLFNCASILSTAKLPKAPHVAIVTNAGGPAVLATDALVSRGGKLAELSPETVTALSEFLPAYWSKSNPIDILGDADEQRYTKAIEIALADESVNGAVVIYTPQGQANPTDLAKAIVKTAKKATKPILTVMMGSSEVAKARQVFYDAKLPTYEFPEEAMKTYMFMYKYAKHLDDLYETPEDLPINVGVSKNYLKLMVRKCIAQRRSLLPEEDSKKLLAAYGITTTMPYLAPNADEAVDLACDLGFPVVMKISSPDISHKSDVGGVILNLKSADEVRKAHADMMDAVRSNQPAARIEGVTIQKMITKYDHELIIGSKKDSLLGPVILFGLGGTEAEFFKDVAVGIPPLNQKLARIVMEKTKTYSVLAKGFRSRPPANLRLLDDVLVKVSNMIIDFPEIKELDINPLVVGKDFATALDARIIIDLDVNGDAEPYAHLMVTPYPTKYIQNWTTSDGRNLLIRPIRPEDEPLERELLAGLSPESSRFRFFQIIKDITHEMLSRFCNIDYDREMAMVAEATIDGKRRIVGVARIIKESEDAAEFAVLVADDFQHKGLGLKLSDILIGIGQEKGFKNLYGIVLNDNRNMIELARRLGFQITVVSSDESRIELLL